MTLVDVCDFAESLAIADHVYMGDLPEKDEKSIGVYNSKHQQVYHTALGGASGYGQKYVTFLIHWNKSLRETEKAATALFDRLCKVRGSKINQETIQFIQPLYDLQDIGKDDNGICEMVIEAGKRERNHNCRYGAVFCVRIKRGGNMDSNGYRRMAAGVDDRKSDDHFLGRKEKHWRHGK